ncbi:MAG: AAA family ATPase, partial [Endozoicomonadaceae bacterium]|nr:AAA family ATPase [Endozoicomonadaceae bacterium]
MKLVKLEINNFRQFYGKQVIDFAVEQNKGVTLIHGENNGGKTALLNALRWCLYEETTENLQDSKHLLNKHALIQGKNTFSVNLQLEHDNRLLEVRRSQSKINSVSKVQVFEINDGCYSERPEENPNTLINTFLPKEMSQYFFYQGEGTGTLNSQNDFSHIKGAIDKVLGLTVANTTMKHLDTIKIGYQKDLRQYDTNNEVENLIADKEIISDKLNKDKATLDKSVKELEIAEKKHRNEISKLERFNQTAIESQIKLRSQKQKLLSDYERQYKQKLAIKLSSSQSWAFQAFSNKLSSINLSTINTEELKKSLRYSVDKQLLEDILQNKECICGNDIDGNSAALSLLEKLGKHAIDPELKRRWSLSLKFKDKLEKNHSPKEPMQHILGELDDYEDSIQVLQSEI